MRKIIWNNCSAINSWCFFFIQKAFWERRVITVSILFCLWFKVWLMVLIIFKNIFGFILISWSDACLSPTHWSELLLLFESQSLIIKVNSSTTIFENCWKGLFEKHKTSLLYWASNSCSSAITELFSIVNRLRKKPL